MQDKQKHLLLSYLLKKDLICVKKCKVWRVCKPIQQYTVIHGHRTLKALHPVRSAKLTRVPPS